VHVAPDEGLVVVVVEVEVDVVEVEVVELEVVEVDVVVVRGGRLLSLRTSASGFST
jgi:hypothetical protein